MPAKRRFVRCPEHGYIVAFTPDSRIAGKKCGGCVREVARAYVQLGKMRTRAAA